MAVEPLSRDEVSEALTGLEGWEYADDKLVKSFKFGSFTEAMSFIVRLGFAAESMDHHPELFNVYSRVDIALTTHDAGNKVSARDVKLAKAIEDFVWT